jgi:hypothetical protein
VAGVEPEWTERQRHPVSLAWHDRCVLHLLLYGLLAILLAGGLFFLAARFLPAGEQIAPAVRDEPPWDLPADRALHPDDVDAVRLPVALRGYRFAETDILLDRLAGELRARDEQIARLRGELRAPDETKTEPFHPVPSGNPAAWSVPSPNGDPSWTVTATPAVHGGDERG